LLFPADGPTAELPCSRRRVVVVLLMTCCCVPLLLDRDISSKGALIGTMELKPSFDVVHGQRSWIKWRGSSVLTSAVASRHV
jgi:hypothetical protein